MGWKRVPRAASCRGPYGVWMGFDSLRGPRQMSAFEQHMYIKETSVHRRTRVSCEPTLCGRWMGRWHDPLLGVEMSFKATGPGWRCVRKVTLQLSEFDCTHARALDRGNVSVCVFPAPLPTLPLPFPAHAENSSTDQRQACKKHELYVSFRDLGWQVRGHGWIGPLVWAPRAPHGHGLCPTCAVSRASHLRQLRLPYQMSCLGRRI